MAETMFAATLVGPRRFEVRRVPRPEPSPGQVRIAVEGCGIIAGYHQDGARQVNLRLWNWRGLDVINAHEHDPDVYVEGMRGAAHAVARGHLDPRPLYTHRFTLGHIGEAFTALEQRPDGFLKALVTP